MGIQRSITDLMKASPSFSMFDFGSDNKLSYKMGKVVPARRPIEIHANEEVDIPIQGLTRFMPLEAPVMQRYIQDVIAFSVPLRLLWSEDCPIWNSNKFFNPATPDASRPAVPMVKLSQLYNNNNGKVIGSLFDYLGYPTYTYVWEKMFKPDSFFGVVLTSALIEEFETTQAAIDAFEGDNIDFSSFFDLANINQSGHLELDFPTQNDLKVHVYIAPYIIEPTATGEGTTEVDISVLSFFAWVNQNFTNIFTLDPDNLLVNSYNLDSLDDVVRRIGLPLTSSSLVDKYYSYVFSEIIRHTSELEVSLLPWLAYHKMYSDWFLNTSLIDPDEYMAEVYDVVDKLLTPVNGTYRSLSDIHPHSYLGTAKAFADNCLCDGDPCPRMWMDDYFTTAYPNNSAGAGTMIPVNGSIQSFWVANRLEMYRLTTLLAGKRFQDQVWAHRGVKMSDLRASRTEVLGRWKTNLVVSDVLQNSASDESSKLGTFAGMASTYGSDHLAHYKAEEPCFIMLMVSVRPTTAYVDQVDRMFYRTDFYDFENPAFDNVGMQEIMTKELYPALIEDNSVFGYSPRRYAEYMQSFNEVHGDFKTSLDYWHAARKFSDTPALNLDFCCYTEEDGLERIFSDMSGDNVLSQFYFDIRITRPLSRYVNYHI